MDCLLLFTCCLKQKKKKKKEKKSYSTTKLACLAIVLATSKLFTYLMSNKFDIYADHYTLQWLKFTRTGSALLYSYSAALEEFNFITYHWPGKAQNLVDGLSQLPVEQVPPDREEAALSIQPLVDEEAAGKRPGSSTTPTMWG